MTKKEIVERYLKHIGFVRTQGDTFEPVVPIFILDLMYQLHNKNIAGVDFRFKSKYHHDNWMEAYTKFNNRFFNTFNIDEQDEVGDMMEEFEQYMAYDLDIALYAVMAVFTDLPVEDARVVSSISLCNTLAYTAQAYWGNVYRKIKVDPMTGKYVPGEPRVNNDIKAITYHSIRLLNVYYRQIGGKNTQALATDNIIATTENLIRKTYKWLKSNS